MKFTLIAAISLFAAVASVKAAPAKEDTSPKAAFGLPSEHWICTCFNPAYDYGCCGDVNGTMMTDGNVCDVPDRSNYVNHDKFEACCTRIKGKYKCK